MTIEVSEIYGAVQGEGPNLGRPSLFLRFHRCNLSCKWCDSAFTWDKEDAGYDDFTSYESVDALLPTLLQVSVEAAHPPALVITGGEPMLYQAHLPALIGMYVACYQQLYDLDPPEVEIETAGTIEPNLYLRENVHFNVSHKLRSSGNEQVPRSKLWNEPAAKSFLRGDAIFKPVVGEQDDESLDEYFRWLELMGTMVGLRWRDIRPRIYLMPEGQTREQLTRRQPKVLDLAVKYKVRATTRLHILAYGDERKR